MDNCLFCKIIKGEVPSNKVYEDDFVYAFRDIQPMAPVHVLMVPKVHISSVNDLTEDNSDSVARIFAAAPNIAHQLGVDKSGYRIVSNCGEDAGQTVFHLHFHLLGGQKLKTEMC